MSPSGDVLVRETLERPGQDAHRCRPAGRRAVADARTGPGSPISTINPNEDRSISGSRMSTGLGPATPRRPIRRARRDGMVAVRRCPRGRRDPDHGDPVHRPRPRPTGAGSRRLDVGMPAALTPSGALPTAHRSLHRQPEQGRRPAFVRRSERRDDVTPLDLDSGVSTIDRSRSQSRRQPRHVLLADRRSRRAARARACKSTSSTFDADGTVLGDRILPHRDADADYDPSFLPDGRLVFWRNHAGSYCPPGRVGRPTSMPRRSISVAAGAPMGAVADVEVMASPDGRQLLLVRRCLSVRAVPRPRDRQGRRHHVHDRRLVVTGSGSPRGPDDACQPSASHRWGLDRSRSRPHSSQKASHSARGAPSQRSSSASVWRIGTPSSTVRSRARSR